MALLSGCWCSGQETPTFRSETSLALLSFHAIKAQRYVVDLKRDDVVLLEDGVERPFSLFEGAASAPRTVPVELMLLFDTSGSVTDAGLLDPVALKQGLLDELSNVALSVFGFDSKLR